MELQASLFFGIGLKWWQMQVLLIPHCQGFNSPRGKSHTAQVICQSGAIKLIWLVHLGPRHFMKGSTWLQRTQKSETAPSHESSFPDSWSESQASGHVSIPQISNYQLSFRDLEKRNNYGSRERGESLFSSLKHDYLT